MVKNFKVMKLNPLLRLWEVGDEYMIVNNSKENVNLSNVFNLNETAAYLWKKVSDKDFTKGDLVEYLLEEYDVDRDTAERDIEIMLEEWKNNNFII